MAEKKRKKGRRYTESYLFRERKDGFYWYASLWRVLRPVMVLVCSLALVAGLVTAGWNKVYGEFLSPVDADNDAYETFVISSGESVSTIGKNLCEQGLLRNRGLFGYIIQFRGLTNSIQYGTYELSPSMTTMQIIDELASGSATNERTITIIPGWTVSDIAVYLVNCGALKTEEEFTLICKDASAFTDSCYALQQVTDGQQRIYALEGYLAPDTYRIFLNASAESIVKKLLGQTDKVMDKLIYAEPTVSYDENGELVEEKTGDRYETTLTSDETLILASVIEKEAGRKEDYAKISAVFHNRLERGMKLESDATVSYVLGLDHLALTSEELGVDSPYNTYKVKGLPAGPICNPSAAAIEAALYPDVEYIEDGYLYFCAKEPESGETAFARTLQEHEANVAKYRQSWIDYDNKKAAEKNK